MRPLLRLLATVTAGGVVVALTLLPLVGTAGVTAAGAATSFERLPGDLRTPTPPQNTRLLAADGSPLAVLYVQDRVDVPLSAVAPVAARAIVAIEDARYWQHGALDLHGIVRAALGDLASGRPVQGASTLTQQYVKNVLVQGAASRGESGVVAAAQADTLGRKIREARYAVALEHRLTKRQILQRYLNIVYFGDGAYGIQAAAEHYFSVPASRLGLDQAALLAGLVQDPTGYDPVAHPGAARARRNTVIARMAQLGVVSRSAARAAERAPLALRPRATADGCAAGPAPFFCEWAIASLLADPALGATPAARLREVLTGGLTLHTTLRPKMQAAAQQAVNAVVPPSSPLATAVDAVVPGTGAVAAMAVDRPYGPHPAREQTTVNLATGGGLGYPAGSTFKLFTLAAALQHQVPLSYTLDAPPRLVVRGFRACGSNAQFPPYPVTNAGPGEGGRYSLVRATWESVNTYYVQLERKVGLCAPATLARRMGVTQANGKPLADVPSFTLGANSVSPLSMAAAYAAMAAGGRYCRPVGIVSITDGAGRHLAPPGADCRQVVSPAVAAGVTSVLRGVIDGPDPARTGASAGIGRPAAGKTGTTDNFAAAWFDGYTPQLAAAAWVGNPAGGFAHPMVDVTVAGRFYPAVYGADLPAQVWRLTMAGALAGTPVAAFPGAGGQIAPDRPAAPPGGPRPARSVTVAPPPAPPPPRRPGAGHHRRH